MSQNHIGSPRFDLRNLSQRFIYRSVSGAREGYFIGTSTDESSDDLCTVQIPTSWRSGNTATPSHHAAAPLYLESAEWAQDPLADPLLALRENLGGWCGSL